MSFVAEEQRSASEAKCKQLKGVAVCLAQLRSSVNDAGLSNRCNILVNPATKQSQRDEYHGVHDRRDEYSRNESRVQRRERWTSEGQRTYESRRRSRPYPLSPRRDQQKTYAGERRYSQGNDHGHRLSELCSTSLVIFFWLFLCSRRR